MVIDHVGRDGQPATTFSSSFIYRRSVIYSFIMDKYICCLSDFMGVFVES